MGRSLSKGRHPTDPHPLPRKRSSPKGLFAGSSFSKKRSESKDHSPPPRPSSRKHSRSREHSTSGDGSSVRSWSPSLPGKLNVKMPHNVVGDVNTGVVDRAQVLERPAVNSGETLWQAEIVVPQGGVNHSGRTRVFTVRGPPRKSHEQAQRDAGQLNKAAADGPKSVRLLANDMHRPS